MPLRDHFRPPLDNISSWEGLHGGWPMVIVQHLQNKLPPGFTCEPRVHSGSQVEIDVSAFEKDDLLLTSDTHEGNGCVATAVWVPEAPCLAVETTLPDFDEYEVRVYELQRRRRLVAAIEIVSPANNDRPEHRQQFVGKCTALMRQGVAVSIVDLVTLRHFNLYADLLESIGHHDTTLSDPPPPLYAAACRYTKKGKRTMLEAWSNILSVGQPLPTLPLWLASDLFIPLNLEESYEKACKDLRLP